MIRTSSKGPKSDFLAFIGGRIKAADTPANLTGRMRAAGRMQQGKKVTPVAMDDDWADFTVSVDSGTDSREKIARLCSQHGWPLRSLGRCVATLEDVFVELTRQD